MLLAAEWATTPNVLREHPVGDLQLMRWVVIERRRAAAATEAPNSEDDE